MKQGISIDQSMVGKFITNEKWPKDSYGELVFVTEDEMVLKYAGRLSLHPINTFCYPWVGDWKLYEKPVSGTEVEI